MWLEQQAGGHHAPPERWHRRHPRTRGVERLLCVRLVFESQVRAMQRERSAGHWRKESIDSCRGLAGTTPSIVDADDSHDSSGEETVTYERARAFAEMSTEAVPRSPPTSTSATGCE
jgi:hypothetical protein